MPRRNYPDYDQAVVRDDRPGTQRRFAHRDIYQERSHDVAGPRTTADYPLPQDPARDDNLRTGRGYGRDERSREGTPTAYSASPRAGDLLDPDIEQAQGRAPEYWGGHFGDEDRFASGMTDRYGYGRGTYVERDIYDSGEDIYARGAAAYREGRRDDDSEPRSTRNYRGLGPKGYERSDARILEEVCEHLTDDPTIDASEIEVSCENGIVTLSGSVDSRTKKYCAESLAADIRGVKDIVNDLSIATGWPGGRPVPRV